MSSPDELGALAARLGYALDPAQLSAMAEAVAGAESAVSELRGIPVPPAAADPAAGEYWLRPPAGAATDGRPTGDDPLAAALRAAWSGRVPESLDRLERLHAELNCTIRVLRDRALGARPVDGPLTGVPFAVKDVIDVSGVPTTAASRTRADAAPAAESATVVARLEAAGAVAVSKDATTEFAVGGPHPPLTGACRNPWDTGRWAGGSSTGTAAAVAAGVVPFGLGTDVGGSVRLPAAWSGLTGLKPTAGAIPRTGSVPLSWTAETIGPLARDARTVGLVFGLLRGPDGRDPRAPELPALPPVSVPADLRGLRIACPGGYLTELCDGAVRAGVDHLLDVLTGAGAQVVAGEIPSAHLALPIGYQIVFAEAAAVHRADAARWDSYDPVTVRRISQGITTPAADHLRALQFRVQLQHELDAVFAGADLIVVPTTPGTAPRLPDCTVTVDGERYPLYAAQSRATMLGNLTGAPGLALPTGFAPDGCPVSALLIARPHDEITALRVAALFQDRTDHHRRRTPVAERIGGPFPPDHI
ncbi:MULTISPECIES: amidase [Pseudonocardia]|uniref:Biuret hydrolase n=2 Tax=Pseudonocardia TaxID=1847 RepID=A0A1Y2MV76_PSEAH|nr:MULTISPECIES: amidase [Pseudonocardia]OSY38548.1 Biuret hydrolase [Pseudonocardia autotrophica]TDN77009.1 aspartyl-tRNA(Asn)/glutamyl-tRNA(Gln) amidotransferase subunit A [Pseudonocardia autotrophica]BBG01015.1 amidase [Pseudonocardia autotrophica]GEC29233.1 amidase [Pseudonocardia saturnea]